MRRSRISAFPDLHILGIDVKPEILRVVGVWPSIYDLGVTFSIESAGKTIYRHDMGRMTRTVGFDGGRRVISEAQHRTRIKEYG